MFERLATGWELSKESLRVLKADKELLLFPLLSGIATLLVLASFAAPLYFTGTLQQLADDPDQVPEWLTWVVLFAFYFVSYFVVVFFNTALVACAIIRFRGGDPTVSDGFGAAMSRLPQIAQWAAVSATVGVVLKVIESRSEKVGQFATSLMGAAWSVATFFVVPVFVIERVGPVDAVKRSVQILRKTWGESLASNMGTGLIVMLMALPGVLCLMGAGALLATEMAVLGYTLAAIGILWVLGVSLVSSALGSIMLAALYLFAIDEEVPTAFNQKLLRHAFATK